MPFDSNGLFTLTPGYLGITGQTILTSQHNPPLEDIASGLSVVLLRNGVAPMGANLSMGGFKVTNLAAGVASTDAANVGQTSTLAAAVITGATTKATPVDADTLPIVDSAAGNALKRITWANLKALFQPASAVLTALTGIGTAVAGDVIYATGSGAWGRLAKGTARQALLMNAGATAPAWTTLPFTKSYVSAQQTISSAGLLTLTHGLGAQPELIQLSAVCVTAEQGYSIGDVLVINPGMDSGSGSTRKGVSVTITSTTISLRYSVGSPFSLVDKTTGDSNNNMTNSNWRLVVKAWA